MSNSINIPDEIFKNAINAIELGVEDYELSTKDSRRLQSAVRNVFAGILLLFKSKLAELSQNDDESLLKQKVVPVIQDGEIKWVGSGKKTVDVQQIQDRFISLKIEVDWKKLDALQNYRNNIEHYFDKNKCNITVVRQYIVSGFIVVHAFLTTYLNKNPKKCFSNSTWEVFLREQTIVENELKNRDSEFSKLKWYDPALCDILKSFHCAECDSNLINVVSTSTQEDKNATSAQFECRVCGTKYSYAEMIRNFCAVMANGRIIFNSEVAYNFLDECPLCGDSCYDTFIDLCYLCGATSENFECERCGETILPEEISSYISSRLCGYCEYQYDKWMGKD